MASTVVAPGGPAAVSRRYHGGIAGLDGSCSEGDIQGVGIAVLGPLELDGTTSTLGLRDRVVLEALSVRPGAVVRAESLAEAIWGQTPPPSWPKVVQGCISRLRKTLGDDVIETAEHGYRLRVHVDHLDHLRLERLVGRARELLTLGEPERADYLLREALDLWRGEPFSELNGWAPGLIELERLDLVTGTVSDEADLAFTADRFVPSPDDSTMFLSGPSMADGTRHVALLDPVSLRARPASIGSRAPKGVGVYSPDGARFAISNGAVVSLWDARSVTMLASLATDGGSGSGLPFEEGGVGFAVDGRVLIASTSAEVLLWDPDSQRALEAACRMAGRDLTDEEWQTYLPDRGPFEACPQ